MAKGMQQGLVVKKMADKFHLDTPQGREIVTARAILKENKILVGDKVFYNTETMNIETVGERKNTLLRPPMANLDQLFIVLAQEPIPDFLMLDKMLIFCMVNSVEPIICLNKIDKGYDNQEYINKVYGKHFKIIFLSAHTQKNVDEVVNLLNGKTSAFAGQSGVGKSALINALFKEDITLEGNLSYKIARGKNTTRHIELFEIFKHSYIADTPGFTALDEAYLPITAEKLPYYYPDFLAHLSECKYKSCLHNKEQECGIKKAVKEGKIDEKRYIRYLTILQALQSKKTY